jgi:hypothetical protein
MLRTQRFATHCIGPLPLQSISNQHEAPRFPSPMQPLHHFLRQISPARGWASIAGLQPRSAASIISKVTMRVTPGGFTEDTVMHSRQATLSWCR